jgi:hypothetical protein
MADHSEHKDDAPSMGLDRWLQDVHPSRGVVMAVTITLTIFVAILFISTCWCCFSDARRRRVAAANRQKVHPVSEAEFDAATAAPAPAAQV